MAKRAVVGAMKTVRVCICWLLKLSGANWLFRHFNRHRVLILWYHGISQEGFDLLKGYDERHLSPSLFRRHLRFLKARGYQFISLDEYLEACSRSVALHKSVVITFDDGFQNVIENAVPILREAQAKAIMYVVVECAKSNQLLWTDRIEFWVRHHQSDTLQAKFSDGIVNYSLTTARAREIAMRDIKKRLRKMADRERQVTIERFAIPKESAAVFRIANFSELKNVDHGVLQIASHTMNHPNCANLRSEAEFNEEIGHSKMELQQVVGSQVRHFAYPAGSYNDRVVAQVKKFAYDTAVTTEAGFNDASSDPYRLKRVGTNGSFIMFQAMTSGSYFFLTQVLRRRKRGNT